MLVRVVNDNVHPYTEKFKGEVINIPPKGSITMDHNEASHFLGTRPQVIEVDASGIQKPTSYKMLRIEKISDAPIKLERKYICQADGREFPTQSALEAHIAENYMDSMVDEDAKEKLVAKRARGKRGVTDDSSRDSDGGTTKV